LSVFSNRLKWLREKRGLTQAQFAEIIKMSRPGYTKIEQGQREPNLDTLITITKTLGERSDFLLGIIHYDHESERLINTLTLYKKHVDDARDLIARIIAEGLHTDTLKDTVASNEKWINKNKAMFNELKKELLERYKEIPDVPDDVVKILQSEEIE
jgi:transcriptional regulator with XRE-family HTH domain